MQPFHLNCRLYGTHKMWPYFHFFYCIGWMLSRHLPGQLKGWWLPAKIHVDGVFKQDRWNSNKLSQIHLWKLFSWTIQTIKKDRSLLDMWECTMKVCTCFGWMMVPWWPHVFQSSVVLKGKTNKSIIVWRDWFLTRFMSKPKIQGFMVLPDLGDICENEMLIR